MRNAVLFLALAAATPAPIAAAPPRPAPSPTSGCTLAVAVSPNRDGLHVSPQQAARLVADTRAHFIAAARAACTAGIVTPRDLLHFRRLVLRDADGTTEPMLFTREAGPGAAILDFAYQSGPAPTVAALRDALRCWKRPSARGCDIGD
ncbi:MAG TPA: hypothetical protein VGC56_06260 [Allosphingosinicella sp.]|jgi:hypothetical protein